ncbi:unnamed protein product [Pleuronectes platessa]|uniref:Uncharacterized protein n=1 Tax=Pleuronectes platessa TaxID=8262 RepID=A0A9N7TIN0_PLEPL|nr:unnamed protein product [Pleuronectes platessa]
MSSSNANLHRELFPVLFRPDPRDQLHQDNMRNGSCCQTLLMVPDHLEAGLSSMLSHWDKTGEYTAGPEWQRNVLRRPSAVTGSQGSRGVSPSGTAGPNPTAPAGRIKPRINNAETGAPLAEDKTTC